MQVDSCLIQSILGLNAGDKQKVYLNIIYVHEVFYHNTMRLIFKYQMMLVFEKSESPMSANIFCFKYRSSCIDGCNLMHMSVSSIFGLCNAITDLSLNI